MASSFLFSSTPESYHRFFFRNKLYDYDNYNDIVFELTGSKGEIVRLKLGIDSDSLNDNKLGIYDYTGGVKGELVSFNIIENPETREKDTIESIKIIENGLVIARGARSATGGDKKTSKLPKKEILGKLRCIYKVPGSRKEHIKHKGELITVTDYKKLMKAKPTKTNK
jgi:hypothetical protein